jgi:hypothetical protein
MAKSFELKEQWLKRLTEQLNGISYGTVQITLHNGEIVQIDRTERTRYDVRPVEAPKKSDTKS